MSSMTKDEINVGLFDECKRLQRELAAVTAERDSWRSALLALTPGGSELNDPNGCAEFVHEKMQKWRKSSIRATHQFDALLKWSLKAKDQIQSVPISPSYDHDGVVQLFHEFHAIIGEMQKAKGGEG